MTDHLDLPDRYRRQIEEFLAEHVPEAEVWAYGSRVRGSSRAASDLDLVLRGPGLEQIPIGQLADLEEAFEESNIPVLIQTHDWARLPASFHEEIERQYFVLQRPRTHLRARRPEQQATRTARDKVRASEWVEGRWGDLATLEYGRSLRGYKEQSGRYRVYGTNGPIGEHDTSLVKNPTVIIGRKGAYRGVHYSPDPCFVIDTAFYLKPTANIDIRWAYYQLLTQDINGMDSGSAVPSTSRPEFYQLPVKIPPLSEQRAIAGILGALDDRIEMNRRMSETLEEMARALFKSWFVDFDPVHAKAEGRPSGLPPDLDALFPAAFEESELGAIPTSWNVKPLGDLMEQLRDSEDPQHFPETTFDHYSIPAFDQGQIPNQEYGKEIKSRKFQVPSGAVLVSRLNPEIERVWRVILKSDERAICSTEFLVLKAQPPVQDSYVYCLARSRLFREDIESLVTGTSKSHQRAGRDAVLALNVISPSAAALSAFDHQTRAILDQSLAWRRASRNITEQRDALLPRLLSGKLPVSRLEAVRALA